MPTRHGRSRLLSAFFLWRTFLHEHRNADQVASANAGTPFYAVLDITGPAWLRCTLVLYEPQPHPIHSARYHFPDGAVERWRTLGAQTANGFSGAAWRAA